MKIFADIHCHLLYDTDDGATDAGEMFAMADMSYADGVRLLCVTPHFNTNIWRGNTEKCRQAYDELVSYLGEHYPDMQVFRGNELNYQTDCIAELRAGRCLTLAGSRYVLVDFSYDVNEFTVVHALEQLAGHGYLPVLAHAERYVCFHRKAKRLAQLRDEMNVVMQVNAGSVVGDFGVTVRRQARRLLKLGAVDVIASDAHHTHTRRPGITAAYDYIAAKHGSRSAQSLCLDNPAAILKNEQIF